MSLRFPSHPNHELMRKLRKSDHSMQKWSLLYRLGVLTCEASLTLFGIKMRAYGRHHEPYSGDIVCVIEQCAKTSVWYPFLQPVA